ncbi:MAG: hypothetical protein V4484_16125 [Pseudomonadota bacterium]
MNKRTTSALALCLSAMILAGCGGGNSQASNNPPPDPTLVPVILPGPIPLNSPAVPTGHAYAMSLAIPPRKQWNTNYGYCGEVSFISAGLYFGQYVSQYAARTAATPGVSQSDSNSQLLVSVNDLGAAATMHLNAAEWNWQSKTATTSQFLAWVKGYVVTGYPVIIGIYVNKHSGTSAGFSAYDHIVPVTGIASNHPLVRGLEQTYYADDSLQFGNNGGLSFQYDFGPFAMTRVQANDPLGPPFALALHVDANTPNAAVAITGVIDRDKETVPVRLATNLSDESTAISNGSNTAPAATPLTLTATVYGLTAGVKYNVYQYNSLATIPDSAFNANASAAYQRFTFTATEATHVLPAIDILSNQVAAFRAVPVSAH